MRLTVEFLRDVYERTGFVPVRNWYRIEEQGVVGADPFYALYYLHFRTWPSKDAVFRDVLDALPELCYVDPFYLDGFILGWHGGSYMTFQYVPWPNEYRQGYEDAQEAVRELDAQCPDLVTWDEFVKNRKEGQHAVH